jgi:hypothetical protein
MTSQTFDQYKEEHLAEAERNVILFGENPLREFSDHTRRAAALLLSIPSAPDRELAEAALNWAQWHLSEAEALRAGPLKALDKG